MITANFMETNREFLYQLNLIDLPGTQDTIIEELKTENWIIDPNRSDRKRCFNPQGNLLNKILSFALSDRFKKNILDILWANDNVMPIWPITVDDMMSITSSTAVWINDLPGYNNLIHIDNRLLVAISWIHFIIDDDPNQCTTFYLDEYKSSPLSMPSGFGQGWTTLNTHNAWHSGWNLTQVNRYSLSYVVVLNAALKSHPINDPFVYYNNSIIQKYWNINDIN